MRRIVAMNDDPTAGVADVRRGDFACSAGRSHCVHGQDLIVVGLARIGCGRVIVQGLGAWNSREQTLSAARDASQYFVAGDWRVAGVSFRPSQVYNASDS